MFMPSLVHRYTARPDPSVRNDPAEPERVVITVPLARLALAPAALPPAGLALAALPLVGLPPAGLALACDPPLLHAAASSAAASGMPSLTGTGSRASSVLCISIVFLPGYGDDPGP